MKINELIDSHSELTDTSSNRSAVVLMTRIRLARNLQKHPFPGWAKDAQKREIRDQCMQAVAALPQMKRGLAIPVETLDELQKQILVERHLISRELCHSKAGSGIIINKDQSCVVMVNEEDHLRIQVLRVGFQFKKVWATINALDSNLEEHLDYAFSPKLGYLSACPTNLGTGMRASAMMHLPALVISAQMEKVVRAVGQLGMVVRGLFGEGSDASGSIFQISNQTTLGESEEQIIKHLHGVLTTIVDQELNARAKLLETDPKKIYDKIGRAYGILQNGYLLSSGEAMNLLSLIRLGIDLGVYADAQRGLIDRLFIECQPGHVQHAAKGAFEPGQRDVLRAERLRAEFAKMPAPDFSNTTS
ncbi:MAG: protein arginine kinase [Opitutaceae bacterium]|nr:protein arginine kinase [Opitutaceae bacterium]NBR57924.1 protein arginine kinase [Opitutaceae bacterium]